MKIRPRCIIEYSKLVDPDDAAHSTWGPSLKGKKKLARLRTNSFLKEFSLPGKEIESHKNCTFV